MAKRVISVPVLVALGVAPDGHKRLLSLRLAVSEASTHWGSVLEGLQARGLRAPKLVISDGHKGLTKALEKWPGCRLQRCTEHKRADLLEHCPAHARRELRRDYNRIVYAKNGIDARKAYDELVAKWTPLAPAVVRSLEEAGNQLLTFYEFPRAMWKSIRTTNALENLNREFRRRTKTQASFSSEESAVALLFGLIASGQIQLRRIDGYQRLSEVLERAEAGGASRNPGRTARRARAGDRGWADPDRTPARSATGDMVDEILFDSGEATLKLAGAEVLTRVGAVLKRAEDRQVVVQGHTDNVPIVGRLAERFPTNWELSAARAVNVARFLQDEVGMDPSRLGATAFSEYQPRSDNEKLGASQIDRVTLVRISHDIHRNIIPGADLSVAHEGDMVVIVRHGSADAVGVAASSSARGRRGARGGAAVRAAPRYRNDYPAQEELIRTRE